MAGRQRSTLTARSNWRIGLAMACLWALTWVSSRPPAHAQDGVTAPARVTEAPAEPSHDVQAPADAPVFDVASAIPPLPNGFRSQRFGDVQWAYHPSIESLATDLQRMLPRKRNIIAAEFGVESKGPIEIRIARSPDELHALAPHASPPPAYAVGVAYPALGLIVISTVTPESWMPPDVGQVLTHELSHVLLHRAVNGHGVPLWFTEGLAVAQAGEHRVDRVRTLWEAAIVDDILPISELSQSFPAAAAKANLAYAESADLVQHLTHDARGKERLRELVRVLAEGAGFEEALLRSYHVDSFTLERDFRRSLSERFRVLPMVLTGTVLWGGIALLAIVAFVRRRSSQRARLAAWAVEEAAEARSLRAQLVVASPSAPPPAPPAAEPPWLVIPQEPGVPTIEHEGERHTLH